MSNPHPHLDTIARVATAAGIAPADPLSQPLDVARANARAYQNLWNHPLPEIGGIAEAETLSPRGTSVRLRIHYPDQRREGLGTLVYFHGGGFALNGIDTHERLMRLLALRSGTAVVGVSYTLAPELRFPGQLDEALAAVAWVRRSGARYGLDAGRLALGGDSAGANLALSTMLALRDQGLPAPALGLLFYGMFSADLDSPSHRAFGGGGFGLTTARMDWFWSQYLADRAQRDNPAAAPLLADLAGLPPQVLIGAGLDCLLDDTVNLATKLERAGVPHTLTVVPGVPHSFMQMSAHLPPADAALSQAAAALAGALSPAAALAAE
ncbi:MAG TPA: alpha/beta hydrolase [Magnetospirillum sp.]|jgi:acetyl esterase|nr:alpha/beta hydrolase [Magnetospirillum sp.]